MQANIYVCMYHKYLFTHGECRCNLGFAAKTIGNTSQRACVDIGKLNATQSYLQHLHAAESTMAPFLPPSCTSDLASTIQREDSKARTHPLEQSDMLLLLLLLLMLRGLRRRVHYSGPRLRQASHVSSSEPCFLPRSLGLQCSQVWLYFSLQDIFSFSFPFSPSVQHVPEIVIRVRACLRLSNMQVPKCGGKLHVQMFARLLHSGGEGAHARKLLENELRAGPRRRAPAL
jgi:hypothetical protein